MAARERARPPRQVGSSVLLRARLREPPAVVDAVTAREMACKTQAARRARAEALAGGVGAVLTHNLLELGARRPRRASLNQALVALSIHLYRSAAKRRGAPGDEVQGLSCVFNSIQED